MGAKFDKALPGFNTNVIYGGKVYHVQTEDSGKANPKIISHVFLDGNIIATKKESYEDLLNLSDADNRIRERMKKVHSEMIALINSGKIADYVVGSVRKEGEISTSENSFVEAGDEKKVNQQGVSTSPPMKFEKGFYSKIYRRQSTPVPSGPGHLRRRRITAGSRPIHGRKGEKIFVGGQEVESSEESSFEGMKEKSDKTLEEIIAEYLSDKIEKT